MRILLEAKSLKKYFQTRGSVPWRRTAPIKAVDGVDFLLHEGETLGIVGESGCGKSTVAKLILMLEKPTSGMILYRGSNVFRMPYRERTRFRSSVSAVFQDPYGSLDPRMRVASIIAEPLRADASVRAGVREERVAAALEQVRLRNDSLQRYPHHFSGGQRQRIALARAIVNRPSVLILDEPISALDVSVGADMMNLLKDMQRDLGLTYLLIAHNLAVVEHMCHRIAVMYLGRIVETAPSKEFYSNALHPYGQLLLSVASRRSPMSGDMVNYGELPSPTALPPGCRFHTRCVAAKEICSETEPLPKEIGKGHVITCHLY